MLARALHFAGDYDGAYSAYERVIERDPQAVVAMNNLAYMLSERLNRPEDALPHAERANELNPDSVEFLDTLGWIRYRLGQTNEAERVLRRSTEIQKRPANCIHLAIVLTERGDNQSIREAIKLAKTARDMARQGGNAPIVERAEKLLKEHDKGSRAQRP
jgi:tetratricopeptide (TPR) repeat protein